MKLSTAVFSFVLFLVVINIDLDQNIQIDYDRNVYFGNYKTFMWINEPSTPKDPTMSKRIVDAINMQLMERGLEHARDADIAVSVNVATHDKQTLNDFYSEFHSWIYDLPGFATKTNETYIEGTLVVDLLDAQNRRVVWRGTVTNEVFEKPKSETHEAEKVIEKLFKGFPPTAL